MSKRTIIILSLLVTVAIGISAYALIPPLLSDGARQAIASDVPEGTNTPDSSAKTQTTTSENASNPGAAQSATNSSDPSTQGSDATGQNTTGQNTTGSTQPSGQQASGGGGNNTPASQANSGTSNENSSSSSNSNSSSSSNPSSSSSTTTTPPPAPVHTVTISIDAETMGRGYIMAARTVEYSEGETVFDVLQRECRSSGIPMESSFNPLYNSRYIEGIDNLYEFDGGPQSGWMYSVNGWYPNYGCSAYTLSDGEVIKWRYTCNLGSDIGGYNALG
jgi:hypothetical protein